MARPLARAPSLSDWRTAASRLGLQRRGGELIGPCPACGGTDRFRVTRRGGFFCRQCCPDRNAGADAMRRILEASGMARKDDGGSLDAGRPRREAGRKGGAASAIRGVSGHRGRPESRCTAIYGGDNNPIPGHGRNTGAGAPEAARTAPDGNRTDKRPSFAVWSASASRLGLKPDGDGMLAGPCPLCRSPSFRVAPDGKIGKCRCKREDLPRILAAAGLVRAADAPEDGRTAPEDGRTAHAEERPLPIRIWAAASRDAAPIRAYLASRGAWPPDAALPPSVRWLDRDAAAKLALRGLPDDAAGAAAYAFAIGPKLSGVQLEALTEDGERRAWRTRNGEAKRWTAPGSAMRGAAFRVPGPDNPAYPVHACEGPINALAIATWRGRRAWGAGGAGMLPALAPALAATRRAVVIEADGDGPGRKAAAALQDALHRADAQARLFYWRGCDPAEGLAAEWEERAAGMENDSMSRTEAEAAAWNAMRLPGSGVARRESLPE